MNAAAPCARLPLQGVRVIDLSRLVAGNMLTLQLADFGADVLKIEDPAGGDTLRHWQEPLPDGGSFDAWWQVYGRNKRSAALDLRDAQARALLKRMLATADVLVESFRPGRLESLGLAPADLHALQPGLVIVRVSGWGQDGPYSTLPGFGSLVEGFSGFAHKHAEEGVPHLPNMALADMVAGLSGAFATLAALREVEVNGGRGQVVDLSLLEPMLSILGPDAAVFAATGRVPDPAIKVASPRGVYRCRDGAWVALSGSTEAMARRVMEAIGQPELIHDPRFANNAARLANDAELERHIAAFVAGLDLAACLALFRERGVTVGPVHDTASLLADEHVRRRGCFTAFGPQQTLMHAVTPRLTQTPGALRSAAPRLGEHTAQVLQDLGLDAAASDALAQQGAIRCA